MKRSQNFMLAAIILAFIIGATSSSEEIMPSNKIEPDIKPIVKNFETKKNPEKELLEKDSIKIPILMYHYIRTVTDQKDTVGIGLSVPPAMFEQQMKYLVDNDFTAVQLEDLESYWNGEKDLPKKPIILTFDDGYIDFYTTAWPILKKYNVRSTEFIVTNFMEKKDQYMDANEIAAMDKTGLVDIGCHGMNHKDLTILTQKQVMTEMKGCKVALEYILKHKVNIFAYPSGKVSPAVAQQVKNIGFKFAVITEQGRNHKKKDRYVLSRVRIPGTTSMDDFKKLVQ